MADKKISQLSAASLPLAGTEVLPIVQSSATVKVAADDLTVKNVRSNATSGILQVVGPAAASTRTMTVPDANFTAARTDAAQTFTGNQTLGDGNLIVGTSGKGIDFSITSHPAGMTSELLSDYEEGTHTATVTCSTSGTISLAGAANTLRYTKIGNTVHVNGYLFVSSVSSPVGAIKISLPFTSGTGSSYHSVPSVLVVNSIALNVVNFVGRLSDNVAEVEILRGNATAAFSDTAQEIQANVQIRISLVYKVA